MAELTQIRFESLNWTKNFKYPNMVRVYTIGDGSCLFHAVISSFFSPYRKGELSGQPLNRRKFVLQFRHELADKLEQPVDDRNPEVRWYDVLGRGELSEFSKTVPDCSLEAMQKELRSGVAVDNKYNEFLSNILDKDIYLLNGETQDIYFTGKDSDILFLGRESIVVLYHKGHYELVGIKSIDSISLMFKPDDLFILAIRKRLAEIEK